MHCTFNISRSLSQEASNHILMEYYLLGHPQSLSAPDLENDVVSAYAYVHQHALKIGNATFSCMHLHHPKTSSLLLSLP